MNNKNKNSIDQLFSEKLQNHKVKPRDVVWENLDRELSKKNGKTYGKYWALMSLFFVMLLGSGTMFFWDATEQEKVVVEQEIKTNSLLGVQEIENNSELEKTIKLVIIDKQETKIQKNHSAITTNKVHKTKIKAINLSTKGVKPTLNKNTSERTTKNKEEVATLQNSNTAEKSITNEDNIEIQNSEKQEILEGNIEKEEETTVILEEKQETKKAGVHLKIRLGTQAGGRDEEREEIEAEERANKKARLLTKVLKGAWNLKKEKQLGKKNNKLKKN